MRAAVKNDALSYASNTRALATELEANGWPVDAVEIMRVTAEAVEMIALERGFGSPPVMQ